MLSCMSCWTTPKEEFFELLLIKVDDQVFDGNGFKILTVALRHYLFVAEEDCSPLWSRHLVNHRKLIGKNLQSIELRSEITSNSLKKEKNYR